MQRTELRALQWCPGSLRERPLELLGYGDQAVVLETRRRRSSRFEGAKGSRMERSDGERPGGGMDGKVCLITGATSGIGKATAMGLANMGASVVMVGRDRGKGEAAMAEIKERKSGNASVDLMLADVSSQEQIRRLADEFKEAYPRLDVLINNAGVFRSKRITSAD